MPEIFVRVDGSIELAAELSGRAASVGPKAFAVVRTHGLLVQTRIVANASGGASMGGGSGRGRRTRAGYRRRPPPRVPGSPGVRVQTGDYRRSWSTRVSGGLSGDVTSETGTQAPQARRLEFGFVGTDALGRHYNELPHVHVRPAFDQIAPLFERAIAEIADFDR
jgi:hypothetical protein